MIGTATTREALWDTLNAQTEWDVIVIGGGIAGAGLFMEAAKHGLKVLLVEQNDFASGTSSRSSKLVHGGMRYLNHGHFKLTRDSLKERDRLTANLPGLVDRQPYLFGSYVGVPKISRFMLTIGFALYDLLAGKCYSRWVDQQNVLYEANNMRRDGLNGAYRSQDSKTDDARLTLRAIQEGVAAGGTAINYIKVDNLLQADEQVSGVALRCEHTQQLSQQRAKVVINSTGAWVDQVRSHIGAAAKMRPLRGSHLIFPFVKFPMGQLISWMHPRDNRPIFIYPWEGRILLGTTDFDHSSDLQAPVIQSFEIEYLMEGLRWQFPGSDLTAEDAIASYAGVRPVVDTGAERPSDESRHHVVWQEKGLLTVTGGKLTTFRLTAVEALNKAREFLPGTARFHLKKPIFDESQHPIARLAGRYGACAAAVAALAENGELEVIPGTETLWVELRWAATHEQVLHLSDLMLRRTRLGLLLENGGEALLAQIRLIVQPLLGWDYLQWAQQETDYLEYWQANHAPNPV